MAAELFDMGWRSLRDLAVADTDELATVVGSVDLAETVIETANDAASGKITLEVKYSAPEPEPEPAVDEETNA